MENVVRKINVELEIDFTALKRQKLALINAINSIDNPNITDNLEGIVNLIDAIQDYALEELGIDENLIFDLENESNN